MNKCGVACGDKFKSGRSAATFSSHLSPLTPHFHGSPFRGAVTRSVTGGSSPHRRFPTASNKGDRKGRPYADLFWMSVGAIHESPVQAFPLRGRWPAGPDEVLPSPRGEGAERSEADEVLPRFRPRPTRATARVAPTPVFRQPCRAGACSRRFFRILTMSNTGRRGRRPLRRK